MHWAATAFDLRDEHGMIVGTVVQQLRGDWQAMAWVHAETVFEGRPVNELRPVKLGLHTDLSRAKADVLAQRIRESA